MNSEEPAGLLLSDYRVRQWDYLLRITRALVSRLDLRAVLRLILQGAVDLLQGQAGLIALRTSMPLAERRGARERVGRSAGEFDFWASYGLPPAMVEAFDPLVEDAPEASETGELVIPDLGAKLGRIAEATGLLLRQVVALPMMVERQIPAQAGGTVLAKLTEHGPREQDLLGIIFVFRSHSLRFSPDERQILANFADYAAVAVNNARLYETSVTEQRRLDALLEASADGIMVLSADLTVERINPALATLTGWSGADAVGRPHDALVAWAQIDSGQPVSAAVASGWPMTGPEMGAHEQPAHPLYVEGQLRRRNGSLVSVGITYAPLLVRTGRLVNIIGVVHDITRFREADTLKDTFISVVSHELKTPVAIIKGYAETLRRPEARRNPVLADEMLEAIVEESDRLAQLVDDLLDVSRLQAGGLPFQDVEPVDLRVIVQRVIDRYQPHTQRHKLVADFPDDYPLIDGDPRRLEQVLDNLISNAVKYSPQGGAVRITGSMMPAQVLIAVQDNGVGVPWGEQERIFERFYRVEGPETRAVSGTGLGLYLTRAIVQAHGGRIWVESTPGHGA
ncbi:MAG: ATP-binding protein, partial [Anaerolineae bacterium]|nr:ATP-binding protein [Anaerolineae bacterium]